MEKHIHSYHKIPNKDRNRHVDIMEDIPIRMCISTERKNLGFSLNERVENTF